MLRLRPQHGVLIVVSCIFMIMIMSVVYSIMILNRETAVRVRMAEIESKLRELELLQRQHIDTQINQDKQTQDRLLSLEEWRGRTEKKR